MPHWHLRSAVRALRAHGVVAYPTEGVYGLGCDPFDEAAVHRILAVKGRAASKGLIVIGDSMEQLAGMLTTLPADLEARVRASWPAAVTWVLPAAPGVPRWLTGGRDTLAVRVPGLPLARRLCTLYGGPLVSTSANRAGHPPAHTALMVRSRLGTSVDYILNGVVANPGRVSEIRRGSDSKVLRG